METRQGETNEGRTTWQKKGYWYRGAERKGDPTTQYTTLIKLARCLTLVLCERPYGVSLNRRCVRLCVSSRPDPLLCCGQFQVLEASGIRLAAREPYTGNSSVQRFAINRRPLASKRFEPPERVHFCPRQPL